MTNKFKKLFIVSAWPICFMLLAAIFSQNLMINNEPAGILAKAGYGFIVFLIADGAFYFMKDIYQAAKK